MAKEACSALIDNGSGKILLQFRDDKSEILYPNMWGTFGGHLDEGETPLEALKRELVEEIEYEVDNVEYLGKYDFIHMFRIVDTSLDIDNLIVHEGQKAGWISVTDLPHIPMFPFLREFLYDYFKRYG